MATFYSDELLEKYLNRLDKEGLRYNTEIKGTGTEVSIHQDSRSQASKIFQNEYMDAWWRSLFNQKTAE